jgi:PKD repeat protein
MNSSAQERIRMRTHISLSILGAAALAVLSGCTVKDIDQPALAGPSTLATSITMKASPDTLIQDGASQSVITITAVDAAGRPMNIPLRADIAIDGVLQDFGRLSTKQPVANGTPLIYTAPASSSLAAGQVPQTVSIVVTPTDGNAFDGRGEIARQVDIRLVPQGVILPSNPNLLASFTVTPESPQAFQNATFDAAASTNAGVACATACSYSWNFGDGTTSSGITTSHAFRTVSTFPVTLTVTDARGATTSFTKSVSVTAPTPPTASFTISPTPAPTNVDVFFNASQSRAVGPGRTIVSYQWNFGDGSTGSGVTTSHRYSGAGAYTVTLTVTDDAQATTQATQVLLVGGNAAQGSAALTATPSAGRPGQRVVFDASASTPSTGSSIVSYKFDYGDGSPQETSGNPVQSHVYSSVGTFVASVEVTDSNGKTSTRTVTVTITAS